MINDPTSATRYYQARFVPEAGRDAVWREICAYLAPYTGDTVLDVGAGYCSFINNAAAREKHALDLYPGFAEFAAPQVQTHIGRSEELSFPADYFDTVFASNLLEHLTREAITATLAAIKRVLKPRGHFVIIQPNFRYAYRDYFDDYTHLQIFTERSLEDLLVSNGFRITRMEPRFIPFSFKSRLPKWPWLVKYYLMSPIRPFAGQMLLVSQPPPTGDD